MSQRESICKGGSVIRTEVVRPSQIPTLPELPVGVDRDALALCNIAENLLAAATVEPGLSVRRRGDEYWLNSSHCRLTCTVAPDGTVLPESLIMQLLDGDLERTNVLAHYEMGLGRKGLHVTERIGSRGAMVRLHELQQNLENIMLSPQSIRDRLLGAIYNSANLITLTQPDHKSSIRDLFPHLGLLLPAIAPFGAELLQPVAAMVEQQEEGDYEQTLIDNINTGWQTNLSEIGMTDELAEQLTNALLEAYDEEYRGKIQLEHYAAAVTLLPLKNLVKEILLMRASHSLASVENGIENTDIDRTYTDAFIVALVKEYARTAIPDSYFENEDNQLGALNLDPANYDKTVANKIREAGADFDNRLFFFIQLLKNDMVPIASIEEIPELVQLIDSLHTHPSKSLRGLRLHLYMMLLRMDVRSGAQQKSYTEAYEEWTDGFETFVPPAENIPDPTGLFIRFYCAHLWGYLQFVEGPETGFPPNAEALYDEVLNDIEEFTRAIPTPTPEPTATLTPIPTPIPTVRPPITSTEEAGSAEVVDLVEEQELEEDGESTPLIGIGIPAAVIIVFMLIVLGIKRTKGKKEKPDEYPYW